eukprot:4418073-Alexandrium_andersonii.AAC.1
MASGALQHIGEYQRGFMPGRQVQELIGVVRWATQKSQEFSRPLAILQMDVATAFDSLAHPIIAKSLLAYEVPGKVVTAIMREIRSTRLKVSVPGTNAETAEIEMKTWSSAR